MVWHIRSTRPGSTGPLFGAIPAIPHKVRPRYLWFSSGVPARRPRVLAVVSRFKWVHIDYLAALGEHFDLLVAYAGEGGQGAAQDGINEGLRGIPIGFPKGPEIEAVRPRLAEAIAAFQPELVHVMYYNHEDLATMARELVGPDVPIVFECRDPVTTLVTAATPGDGYYRLERRALEASDRHIFISEALRGYYERTHGLDLSGALIIPYAFPGSTIVPPQPKLSASDGRTHIALVGTADDQPDHGRWYGDIIRSLVSQGLVVHSHFHDLEKFGLSLAPYRELSEELEDYHFHPTVPHRRTTELSELMSRYDLMGVFHELGAAEHNESATLAVCMPTKSVCGWLHGAIPVVCFPHYRGVVERIEQFDIGFVVDDIGEVGRVAADRAAIAAAGERALACRHEFTTERTAERIRDFVAPLLERQLA
jgi:hypothetical protein